MAFVFIQEGGATYEYYISAWDTEDEAEQSRIDCAADGAYRTTPVVEMPDGTDWNAVEELVQGLLNLECVDVPGNYLGETA